MNKITFVNGTTPAINDTNLNQMQTNIENAINVLKPVVLYTNNTGTTGTVTLSETSANFSYLDIFLRRDTWEYFTRVYLPNGKTIIATTSQFYGTNEEDLYIYSKKMSISGNKINVAYSKGTYNQVAFNDDINYIIRVIGYR